jgi:hypothetical protein
LKTSSRWKNCTERTDLKLLFNYFQAAKTTSPKPP